MKIISLACNNCGAPLDVPVKTRFLTCNFCDAKLEVQRNESASFTAVLESVNELRSDVQELKLKSELEQVDRDWERERGELLVTDKHGRSSVPSGIHLVGVVVAVAFGVFWTIFAANMAPFMAIFGILFVVVAVINGVSLQRKAALYRERKQSWEERRRRVLQQILPSAD